MQVCANTLVDLFVKTAALDVPIHVKIAVEISVMGHVPQVAVKLVKLAVKTNLMINNI